MFELDIQSNDTALCSFPMKIFPSFHLFLFFYFFLNYCYFSFPCEHSFQREFFYRFFNDFFPASFPVSINTFEIYISDGAGILSGCHFIQDWLVLWKIYIHNNIKISIILDDTDNLTTCFLVHFKNIVAFFYVWWHCVPVYDCLILSFQRSLQHQWYWGISSAFHICDFWPVLPLSSSYRYFLSSESMRFRYVSYFNFDWFMQPFPMASIRLLIK